MKLRVTPLLVGIFTILSPVAWAKQDIQAWPIADVIENPKYEQDLKGVDFTWGDDLVGQPIATSTVARATPGIMRTDKEACERALINALREMRLHALQRGAHSVQAIKSTIAGEPYSSPTAYLCMTGHTNSRVELQGKIVMEAVKGEPSPTQDGYEYPYANLDTDTYTPSTHQTTDIFEQRVASPRPVSTPHIDPEQEEIYGTPWE